MSIEVRSEPLADLLSGVSSRARRGALSSDVAPLARATLLATHAADAEGFALLARAKSLVKKVHATFGVRVPARAKVEPWSFGEAVSGAGITLAAKLLGLDDGHAAEREALLALESNDDVFAVRADVSDAFIDANPTFGAKYLANDVFIVEASAEASPMVLGGFVFIPVHRAQDEIGRLVRILGVEAELAARGHIPVDQGISNARLHVQSMLATLARAVARVPEGMAVHWCS